MPAAAKLWGALLISLLLLICGNPCLAAEKNTATSDVNEMHACRQKLDAALSVLAHDLVDDLAPGRINRIAVLDPEGPGETLSDFSAYVVDQLNAFLVDETRYNILRFRYEKLFSAVVERRRLYDIIVQQRVELSSHFDRNTVTPLGNKLGVDGLVFIKISEVASSLLVRAQLIGVKGGDVLAGATVDIPQNSFVKDLLKKPLLSSLTLKLEPSSLSAEVSLDGQERPYNQEGLRFTALPQGMHSILVSAPCHEIYRLNLYLAGHRDLVITPEPKRTRLQLSVNPPNALVRVDNIQDIELDRSGTGSLELPAGRHTITAQAENLEPYSRPVKLGCRPYAMNIDLTKPRVELSLRISPVSGQVNIDGESVALDGKGGWRGMLHQGRHMVEAKAEHHRPFMMTLELDSAKKLDLALVPIEYPITIRSSPPGATIRLGTRSLPVSKTGVAQTKVLPGEYNLSASALGFEDWSRSLSVSGPTDIRIDLKKMSLELEFIAVYEKEGRIFDLRPGSILYSDQNYAVAVKPSSSAYVYVFQVDGTGNVAQLFPDPKFPEYKNPLAPQKWHWIPPQTHWSFLDFTLGTEKVFVVASHKPDPQLERIQARIREVTNGVALAKVGREFHQIIRTRAPGGSRPREHPHMNAKGKVFSAVSQVIDSCKPDQVLTLEFQHR